MEEIRNMVKTKSDKSLLAGWRKFITLNPYELNLWQLNCMVAIEYELEARNLIRFNEETDEYEFV